MSRFGLNVIVLRYQIKAIPLTVTDSAGAKVTQQFNLNVTADTEAPKVNLIRSTNIRPVGK
jgi:hypothetical protein